MDTINLYVGDSSSGERVFEQLPVHQLGKNEYQLLASPGLVLGLAKDDKIKYLPDSCEFQIIERGRNLCIQLYFPPKSEEYIDSLIQRVRNELNGTIDGMTKKQAVFSIPVEAGFGAVEAMMDEFISKSPDSEWYYGNVYDAEDGETPLGWWDA